jgi:hypothetical protein
LSRPELLWVLDGCGIHLVLDVFLRHGGVRSAVCRVLWGAKVVFKGILENAEAVTIPVCLTLG